MKNLVIILMLAFCCNCLADNNQPAHVIITAGQSNTDGRVLNNALPVCRITSKLCPQTRPSPQEPTNTVK